MNTPTQNPGARKKRKKAFALPTKFKTVKYHITWRPNRPLKVAAALKAMTDLAKEHFEAGLLIVLTDTTDHEDECSHVYHGGRQNALGMIRAAEYLILREDHHEQ